MFRALIHFDALKQKLCFCQLRSIYRRGRRVGWVGRRHNTCTWNAVLLLQSTGSFSLLLSEKTTLRSQLLNPSSLFVVYFCQLFKEDLWFP